MRKLIGCCTEACAQIVEPGNAPPPSETPEQIAERKEEYRKYLASAKEKFNERFAANAVPKKSIDEFKVAGQLSQGYFGLVVKAKYIPDKTPCAIKIQSKEKVVKDKQVQNAIREKKILQALDCPFIVKLLYVGQDFPNLYLMMELAPYGDLATSGKNQPDSVVRHFAAQIILALEYLHSCSVMYRDLKPRNVLLFDGGVVKLGDFGLARQCDGQATTICGDIAYCAPEILKKQPYGFKIDWWAFGVTLHDLLVGDLPFPGVGDRDQAKRICDSPYAPNADLDPALQDLFEKLLQKESDNRLGNMLNGEVDVKDHPWFKDVVFVHLFGGLKRIKLPRASLVKAKDIDRDKVFPELMIDQHRAQFADFC